MTAYRIVTYTAATILHAVLWWQYGFLPAAAAGLMFAAGESVGRERGRLEMTGETIKDEPERMARLAKIVRDFNTRLTVLERRCDDPPQT